MFCYLSVEFLPGPFQPAKQQKRKILGEAVLSHAITNLNRFAKDGVLFPHFCKLTLQ